MSNICEDAESNKPFALMGYKQLDISIVGFLLTSYHSLKFRLMFRDKYFTQFLRITCSYAQIKYWENLLYIIVMLFVYFVIYLFIFMYLYIYVLLLFFKITYSYAQIGKTLANFPVHYCYVVCMFSYALFSCIF